MTLITFELNKPKTKGIVKTILLDFLREHFSEKNKNYKNIKRFLQKKYGRAIPTSDRIYCISKNGEFELGMFYDIVQFIKESDPDNKITMTDEFRKKVDTRYSFNDSEVYELPIKDTKPLREHQKECVSKSLQCGSGICIHPTGTGKTLTIATQAHNLLIRNPKEKILIVTLTHLCKQFVGDFIEYGFDPEEISMFGDGAKLNPNTKVVICGTTILTRNLDDYFKSHKNLRHKIDKYSKKSVDSFPDYEAKLREFEKELAMLEKNKDTLVEVQKYLRSVTCLIFDEVHSLRANNEINSLFDFVTTNHKFGYTATLPEDMEDVWNIKGKIGRLVDLQERQDMVDKGIIADAVINVVNIGYKDSPEYDFTLYGDQTEKVVENLDLFEEMKTLEVEKKRNPWNSELDFIAKSEHRMNIVTKIVNGLNNNVLIVVDRIDHGERLTEHLKKTTNKQIYFICGEVESEERENVRKLMEINNDIICVAITRIFSTGINISNLHFIVFANSSVAKVTIIQAIGRGVRLHQNKNKLVIFDFADRLHYGTRHLAKRLQIYKKEGFETKSYNIFET